MALLLTAVGIALWGPWRGDFRSRPNPPNLLLITMDTTRADYLGCYGRSSARTPVIDAVAQAGVRFARCSTSSPLTLPSHSSIMTARQPFEHGVRQNGTGRLGDGNVTLAESLQSAGYATRAAIAAYVLNHKFGIAQGFEVYHDVVVTGQGDPLDAERPGAVVADDACDLLRAAAGRRFFLWAHFFDPHFPYVSTQHPDPTSPAAYADEIAGMDTQIGRILSVLDELGLAEDTLVVLVGDHGEGLGDHGEPRHGLFLYDSTLHVPLLMRWPGVLPSGQVIEAGVRTIDIAPTILALMELPEWPEATGRNLLPLLPGVGEEALELPAYSESFEARVNYGASQLRSLRVGDWKYILAPEAELYNLARDPGELDNRIAAEPELAATLHEQLRELIAAAPPAPGGEGQAVALADDELAKLRSLGYLGSEARPTDEGASELDRFEPRGMNPRDVLPIADEVIEARRLIRSGQPEAGAQMLRGLIVRAPDATRLLADLADAIGATGEVEAAITAYDAAVATSPDDRYVRRMYARYLMGVGRPGPAVVQYQAMLRALPDDTTALQEIAIALVQLQRFKEAEQHLDIALRIEPGTPRLLHAMGYLRWNQRRYREAADYFRQTLAIDPEFAPARAALEKIEAAFSARSPKP